MRTVLFGKPSVTSLALIIPVMTVVASFAAISFSTFATAIVSEQKFTAKLFGDMEVPPIKTNATGWAEFKPILNENTAIYSLNVTDIDNVTAAHIHSGKQGQNGPIVVTLFKPDIPTQEMVSGLLSGGNLTADNLE